MTMNRTSRTALALVGTVGIALALTACGASTPDTSSAPVATATPAVDYVAQNACDSFRIMMDDIQKGVLLDSELRPRIQKIYDDGHLSVTPDVVASTTALLAADTANEEKGRIAAVKQIDVACTKIGH